DDSVGRHEHRVEPPPDPGELERAPPLLSAWRTRDREDGMDVAAGLGEEEIAPRQQDEERPDPGRTVPDALHHAVQDDVAVEELPTEDERQVAYCGQRLEKGRGSGGHSSASSSADPRSG